MYGLILAVASEGDTLMAEKADHVISIPRTLDALTGHYGDVLEWKYVDGLSVEAIAARLVVGPKAAESLLTRARAATGWAHAQLRGDTIVRGPAGWWIDTGGFGKGAALRSLAQLLRAHGVREADILVVTVPGALCDGRGRSWAAHGTASDIIASAIWIVFTCPAKLEASVRKAAPKMDPTTEPSPPMMTMAR